MKNILIIGASRGIGLELARQYRAGGDAVTATARDATGAERLHALGARVLHLDVTDAASCAELVWPNGAASFDVAVVNAGVYGPRLGDFEPPALADFDQVMHTNVLGPMRVLPRLAPVLTPEARVVVITSRMGSMGLRTHGNGWLYRASKAAANSVLKDASLLLAGKAVCWAMHPGWVRTDMGGAGADLDVADSAAGIRRKIAGSTAADNGGFFDIDGSPLSW